MYDNETLFFNMKGQTGSGKTHTIFGGDSYAERGLIPRTLTLIFDEIKLRQIKNQTFKIEISFTEVYKEVVYDLLDMSKRTQTVEQWAPVQVLESENGLVLRNVNVFQVESVEDALNLFFMGNTNRITIATAMNNSSSRSHAVFTIIVKSECIKDGKRVFSSGKINLVDLAGSERMYKVLLCIDTFFLH
jgi:kinesin family protein 6/9